MPKIADTALYFATLSRVVARARRGCHLAHFYSRQGRADDVTRELAELANILSVLERDTADRVLVSACEAEQAEWLRAHDFDTPAPKED